jgi:hypothetical protein
MLEEGEYLDKCLELLNYFGVDYSGKIITLNSGDLGLILNPNSQFYELFGGHSVWEVASYVAKKLNKQIQFADEGY